VEPRLSLVTLGVADLARAIAFYRDVMGWSPAEATDDVAFLELNGVILGLWGHDQLAAELTVPADLGPYHGFALAQNLRSREAVDAAFAAFAAAGATITKPPTETDWGGYSGYVADPDGHRWEVAHNPFWTIDDDGRVRLSAG
jgi:catechol 2,3-dioxygenase-like lactoylglutathione lyase family enzyme